MADLNPDESHWDRNARFDRDCEREPTYATAPRLALPLSEYGAVRLATEFPRSLEHVGRTWLLTGKSTRDMFGEHLAEYASRGRDQVDLRIWATCDGAVRP